MKINNFYFYLFLQFFTNLPRGSEGVSKIRPLLMGTIVGMPERCTCVVSNILIIWLGMYSLGNHLLVFILGYIFRIGYVVNQVGSNIS